MRSGKWAVQWTHKASGDIGYRPVYIGDKGVEMAGTYDMAEFVCSQHNGRDRYYHYEAVPYVVGLKQGPAGKRKQPCA